MNKFLVIARVGDNSLHSNWLGNSKNFDLFLSYFGDESNKYMEQCEYYEQVKGGKRPILAKIIENNWDIISKYDAVWLPDDDLLADAKTISRMFNFFAAFDLSLAQPALSMNSYFSHSSLLQQTDTIIRRTNFIEVMAPIFSQECLRKLKHTFSQSQSGWGLDNLWPYLIKENIAIIDATPITHTRPVGGELYKLNPELSPKNDAIKLQKLYQDINISRGFYPNKFKVFSEITESKRLGGLSSFIKGKYQRIVSKLKARNIEKYKK